MKRTIATLLSVLLIIALVPSAVGESGETPQYEEIRLPIPAGYLPLAMQGEPDGSLLLLAENPDGAYYFLRWKAPEGEPDVIPLAVEGLGASIMDIAQDGQILLRSQSPIADAKEPAYTEAHPVLFVWLDAGGNETGRLTVETTGFTNMEALPGRLLALTDMDTDTVIYDDAGKAIHRMSPMGIMSTLSDATTLYAFGQGVMLRWSLDTFERLPLTRVSWQYMGATAFGPDQTIFSVENEGIMELDAAEGRMVKRMDVLGTDLGDPDTYTLGFAVLPDGTFAVCTQNVTYAGSGDPSAYEGKHISIYRRLTENRKRAPFVITSLRAPNRLLQRAASEFQRAHPELKVETRILDNFQVSGGMLKEDALRVINTELLAGGGGDVLVLDGLPVRQMMERGMLRDITAVADGAGLLPGIRQSIPHEDGNVYAIPAHFSVILLWGKKDAIASIRTFPDILTAPIAPGQARLPTFGWDMRLTQFLASCTRDFLDEQGQFDFESEAFIAFLQTLYDIYNEFLPDPSLDEYARYQQELSDMRNGYIAMYPYQTYSFFNTNDNYDLFGPAEAAAILMPSMRAPGNSYVPETRLGVPASAKDPALSEAFIRLVLREDIREYGMFTEFSTVRAKLDTALEEAIERSRNNDAMHIIDDGVTRDLYEADEAFLLNLRAQMDLLTEAVDYDETIVQFILEETAPFFQGAVSAEEAARAIAQRAWLYVNE